MICKHLYAAIAVAILVLSVSAKTSAQVAPASGNGSPSSSESAADRAKREELIRKNAEIEASKRKNTEANEIISRTFIAGNQAMTAAILASKEQRPDDVIQKYTEAIAQYDEGLSADPEQPAHLTNKAVAMKGRGIETFIMTVKSKTLDDAGRTAKLQAAKNDFIAAAEAATAAVSLIKAQTPPTNFPELQRYNGNKYAALLARAEVMRMVVRKVDPSQAETGYSAFKEYMAVETDPARNSKAQLHLAQMLFEAEAIEKALVEFQVILRNQPDSLEANLGAGLALYAIGDTKAKLQEAAKYLQYFVDFAPDTNDIKAYAKEMLVELRDAEITTPERIKPSTGKRP